MPRVKGIIPQEYPLYIMVLSFDRLSFDERESKVCYLLINHLKLTFVAERPPPPRLAYQELLLAAEACSEYFA